MVTQLITSRSAFITKLDIAKQGFDFYLLCYAENGKVEKIPVDSSYHPVIVSDDVGQQDGRASIGHEGVSDAIPRTIRRSLTTKSDGDDVILDPVSMPPQSGV